MMLDRLQVADLKDEIVSMQMELNSVLLVEQQQQQETQQIVIKSEPTSSTKPQIHHIQLNQSSSTVQQQQHHNLQSQQPQQILQPSSQRHFIPSLHEPSQILKAKQEQKLFENIKNERIKVEIPEIPKDNRKTYGMMVNNTNVQNSAIQSPKSPLSQQQQQQHQQKGLSKFDKLKNDQINITVTQQPNIQQQTSKQAAQQQQQQQPPSTLKLINELKDELDDFDIESEIRSNFIMKKCEPTQSISSPNTTPVNASGSHNNNNNNNNNNTKRKTKEKEKERECSPLSDYLNSVKMELIPTKNNKTNEIIKSETHDGAYDEWLSIQKELTLHLDATCSTSGVKRKEGGKNLKVQTTKALESDLSDIFENHTNSPKSVEKQLDDLFSSNSKSNDLLSAESPPELNELFHVESSSMNEKSVENRLEILFGGPEDDSVKSSSQQDLVETRLEQLFQGSVNANDESALDNASFLYKNSDLTYEMIQKQVQVTTSTMEPATTSNPSNSNKRQWNSGNSCDIFSSSNSSIIFPSSPTASKRPCTASSSSVSFDNKWIDENFDFDPDINMPSETTADDITKHRDWNGDLEHHIDGNQFQLQSNESSNLHQNHNSMQQQPQPMNPLDQPPDIMDASQIAPMNYDDVDDISRQVQNAIDSILNLQSSDPLHYQLDSSFLELNSITSSSPNSPVNHHQPSHNITQNNQHHSQYQMQADHQMINNTFANQKMSSSSSSSSTSSVLPKRKYSRMDDIGDCLIGGSNLDDSPSALSLTLTDSHGDASSASVGEFVNNLLNCDEKSITTS